MIIRKESYGYVEPKNVIFNSVHKPYRPVRACKLPRFMLCRIRPIMQICGNWDLPIAMVPCLHQSNEYIKRKLRVWRAQKFNFLVGEKTVPTSTVLQTSPFHAASYRADNTKLLKFGSAYRHDTVFAPKQ